MQIQFAPRTADAGVVVLPVEKDGLGRVVFGDIAEGDRATILGAARSVRFEGEAGAIADTFLATGGDVRRVVLAGLGAGSEEDYERAGGALAAKLLASGVKALTVDFGALPGKPAAKSVARFAAGAAQRAWRYDV
jgi:leucyl aminopeptidase